MRLIGKRAEVVNLQILQVGGRRENHDTFKHAVRRVELEGGEIAQLGSVGSDLAVVGGKMRQGRGVVGKQSW